MSLFTKPCHVIVLLINLVCILYNYVVLDHAFCNLLLLSFELELQMCTTRGRRGGGRQGGRRGLASVREIMEREKEGGTEGGKGRSKGRRKKEKREGRGT